MSYLLTNKSTGAGSVVVTTGSFARGLFVVPVVRPVATATFVPVQLCERVLMIDEVLVVLVRAMVERFESKGVGGLLFLWNKGNKVE